MTTMTFLAANIVVGSAVRTVFDEWSARRTLRELIDTDDTPAGILRSIRAGGLSDRRGKRLSSAPGGPGLRIGRRENRPATFPRGFAAAHPAGRCSSSGLARPGWVT